MLICYGMHKMFEVPYIHFSAQGVVKLTISSFVKKTNQNKKTKPTKKTQAPKQ